MSSYSVLSMQFIWLTYLIFKWTYELSAIFMVTFIDEWNEIWRGERNYLRLGEELGIQAVWFQRLTGNKYSLPFLCSR